MAGLAQIECRRTDEIADVLDEQDTAGLAIQSVIGLAHRVGVEMTAAPGIDLHRLRTGLANPLGVVRRLLIALDHGDGNMAAQSLNGACQQGRLARPGTGNEIERQHGLRLEAHPVHAGIDVVVRENALFDLDQFPAAMARKSMIMAVMMLIIAVVVMVAVGMSAAVVVGRFAVDPYLALATSADAAHQASRPCLPIDRISLAHFWIVIVGDPGMIAIGGRKRQPCSIEPGRQY